MNNQSIESVDIAIVGGGIIGLSLAIALSRWPLRVAVIEPKSWSDSTPATTAAGKALALNYGSCQFFEAIGLWAALEPTAAPIHRVHVSEQGRFGKVAITRAELKLPALGYLVAEPLLMQTLEQTAQALTTITWFKPGKVVDCQKKAEGYQLTLAVGKETQLLACDLLIAADGVNSTIRQACQIEVEHEPYAEQALVTRVKTSHAHEATAYERFTPLGTLALLPRAANEVALIITAKNAVIERWQTLADPDFLQQLQQVFGDRLGQFLSMGERQLFPLQKIIAKEQVRPGLILLGNAAHAIHPVAAQGLNLSLQDMQGLLALIEIELMQTGSLNYAKLCQSYQMLRQKDQARIIFLTDSVLHFFTHRSAFISRHRHLGLIGLAYLPIAKKIFAKYACGLSTNKLRK